MKRKTFGQILKKKLLMWLIGMALFLVMLTYIGYGVSYTMMMSTFYEYERYITTVVDTAVKNCPYEDEEKIKQQVIKRVKMSMGVEDLIVTAGAIYNQETGEHICTSYREGYTIIKDSNREQTTIYSCDYQYVKEYEQALKSLKNKKLSKHYPEPRCEIQDVYIKGEECIPGVIRIYYVPQNTGTEEFEVVDCTPDNKEEYEHYNVADDKNYTVVGPIISGSEKGSKILRDLDKYMEVDDDWMTHNDRTAINGGITDMHWYGSVVVNVAGTNYRIFYVTELDVMDTFGKIIISIYVTCVVLAVIFAYLGAKIRYIKLKAQYDMEDYRITMTNAMAHDLKSPLMAISGYAENLISNVNTEKNDYYAESIIDNVDYMNSIISNILELSRLESGRIKLRQESIDVDTLVEIALKKYEEAINKQAIEISIKGNLTLKGDKQLLLQAFDNLIGNAVKYTEKKSNIEILMTKEGLTISNPCEEEIGDKINELIKPFVKGDNSRSNKKGSGIGLTIAKNIFELHNYKMSIDFKEGKFIVKVTIKG